jgi:hypothetical protein
MNRDHTEIEELLAIDALGGLDADDRERLARERASHPDACEECARLEAEYAETAGRLAFALTPEPVDEGAADRVLAAARAEAETVVRLPEAGPSRSSRQAWRAVGVAAVVVALALVAIGVLRPSTTSVDASSTQRIVTFTGDTGGTLAMAYTPGEAGAVFWGSGMPDLEEGRVLEIWMIEDGEAVSGGCVSPTDGTVAFSVDAAIGTTDTMAVTEEPADCPAQPTTEPIMLADLTVVA